MEPRRRNWAFQGDGNDSFYKFTQSARPDRKCACQAHGGGGKPLRHWSFQQPAPRFLERAVGVEIVVKRAGGNAAHFAADLGDAAGSIGHEVLSVAQALDRHDAWSPALAPTGASRDQAFLDPLPDQVAFHFREGGLDLQELTAGRAGGVHRRVLAPEMQCPSSPSLRSTRSGRALVLRRREPSKG